MSLLSIQLPKPLWLGAILLGLGGMTGALTALLLYGGKPAYVLLLVFGLIVAMPTFVAKQIRLYWFAVYLFTLQFEVSKNLNNGLAIVEQLGIDYTLWHFTFQVYASDLVLSVLLAFWIHDLALRGKRFIWPKPSWLVVGFLGWGLLSLIDAPSPYLGLVELSRQMKFFLLYLWAVNNIDSKLALRLLVVMGVAILTLQGTVTAIRYQTGWHEPLQLGQSHQDEEERDQYLAVDRSAGDRVRAFGTLGGPGSTLRLCMMVIPFALMLCLRNPMFGWRAGFAVLAAFGMSALLLTYTRAYLLTTGAQVGAAIWIALRSGYLSRMEILLIFLVGVSSVVAVTPALINQLKYRSDSYTVRFKQFEASARMIVANPIFGVGLNNGTGEKVNYVNVSYYEFDPDTQFYEEPTHNLYLSLTSEIGVPGALMYFSFFAIILWRMRNLARSCEDPEIRFFAGALLVVAAGVVVNTLYDPFHEEGPVSLLWLYAGITLALPRIARSGSV